MCGNYALNTGNTYIRARHPQNRKQKHWMSAKVLVSSGLKLLVYEALSYYSVLHAYTVCEAFNIVYEASKLYSSTCEAVTSPGKERTKTCLLSALAFSLPASIGGRSDSTEAPSAYAGLLRLRTIREHTRAYVSIREHT